MAMAVNRETLQRNAGPRWGFAFLRTADRIVPRPLFRAGLAVGTAVAFAFMSQQRKFASVYQRELTGKKPSLMKLWRQFFAFIESFMELLRMGSGDEHDFQFASGPEGEAFKTLARSGQPALFGTFHVGNSDLLGYALSHFGRRIHMIRMRVGNSDDIRWLEERFGEAVSFIWVDRPEAMLFSLKEAIEAGHSIAMKCDRLEQSGRREAFWFLGKWRLFPFTIYHFSLLFDLPVVFAAGWPAGFGRTEITASTIFTPDPAADRATNLERAREHFQIGLQALEKKLRARPELWFNFSSLNPETEQPAPSAKPAAMATR